MKVFVAVRYGDTSVYMADTPEQVEKLLILINEMRTANGCEELMSLEDFHNKYLSFDAARRAIGALVNRIVNASDDDDFSYGSGFRDVEEL